MQGSFYDGCLLICAKALMLYTIVEGHLIEYTEPPQKNHTYFSKILFKVQVSSKSEHLETLSNILHLSNKATQKCSCREKQEEKKPLTFD